MSLTSFLEIKDVKARFREEFEKPKLSVQKDLLAPPLSKRYSLVGTAFDYLLRFFIQHLNPNAIDKGRWIAEAALERIKDNTSLHAKGTEIVTNARERLASYFETGELNNQLIESALLLATLDPVFRAKKGHKGVGIIHQEDIQDVKNLISIVVPGLFKVRELCLLNPTFGKASKLVGGADADLVIDDAIIEIKTRSKFELRREDFDQLIGYYVLHEVGGVGGIQPKIRIRKIAIYFSRHAYFHTFDIEEILDRYSFYNFVKWFIKRASQEFGQTRPRGRLKKNA